MPTSPARKIACEILCRVQAERGFAVDWLEGPVAAGLSDLDHRLATELVMGVLRWRGELDFQIARLARRPLSSLNPGVLAILRLGVYQIRFLSRIPKRAAVNEAVELAKRSRRRSAAALVNAVLRRCQPPGGAGERAKFAAERLEAARRSLPPWLLARWKKNFGPEVADRLALASVSTPRVTLRLANRAGTREQVRARLAAEGVTTRPASYAPRALIVEQGSTRSARLAGEHQVMIQEEGSQLVAALLAAEPGQRVLDLCAAPGVKTAQIAEALGAGRLVASDVSARRLRTMTRRLRGRMPDGITWAPVRLDATRPLPFRAGFDRILLDAPCSGTGTLARHPEIKWRLAPADLERLASSQVKMLSNALELLAPGGRLVYATCSLEPEENERVVEQVLRGRWRLGGLAASRREFPALAPLFDENGYFRTRPERDGMDGFFAAILEQRG